MIAVFSSSESQDHLACWLLEICDFASLLCSNGALCFAMASSPEILLTTPLTKWLELEFCEPATVYPNAMTFADADNDGMSEFLAGSIQGDLFIFKGLTAKYWKRSSGLGMISVVGAGDIMQKKKNVIYVVTGEGTLYTFFITPTNMAHALHREEDSGKSRDAMVRSRSSIEPSFTQKIPPNIVMSVLSDIDGDGYPEILFGMTDRVVRSFKWVETPAGPGGATTGAFITLNKWEFAGQIGNLSATLSEGTAQILVSQPGGSCCRLKAIPVRQQEPVLEINFEPPVYHSPALSRLRNPMMIAHVLGGVSFKDPQAPGKSVKGMAESGRNIFAMCAFDGTVMVCNEDTVLWEHQAQEHPIAIQALPLRDEFVIATSSGAVYVFNDRKKMIKLLTSEPMNGFACGSYGVISRAGEHLNTCAFATICSGGRVIIYYSLDIPCLSNIPSFWRRPKKEEKN